MMVGSHKKASTTAFTLIELLVVISVIGLLMVILLSVLSRVRRTARSVSCQTNLKQWAVVFQMYRNDNDGKLVGPGRYWANAARPYYQGKDELLLCPEAVRAPADSTDYPVSCVGGVHGAWRVVVPYNSPRPQQDPNPEECRVLLESYGRNAWTMEWPQEPPLPHNDPVLYANYIARHWSQHNIKYPADIPLLFDCVSRDIWPIDTDDPPEFEGDLSTTEAPHPWVPRNHTMRYVAINRHGAGQINIIFVDGSMRKLPLKQLWTLKWHRRFNTHGRWTPSGIKSPDWPQWMRRFAEN